MRKRNKQRIEDEIAALAALAEDAIDMSDIGEVKDWSGAVRHRFHRPTNKRVTILLKDSVGERLQASFRAWLNDVSEVWKISRSKQALRPTKESISKRLRTLSHSQVSDSPEVRPLPRAGQGGSANYEDAGRKIMSQFDPFIIFTIKSALGSAAPDLIDDIRQAVNIELVNNVNKLRRWVELRRLTELRRDLFADERPPSYFYIAGVTLRIAQDFIAAHSAKVSSKPLPTKGRASAATNRPPFDPFAVAMSLDELSADASLRDSIVRDLFLQGFTPEQISTLPGINLSERKVNLRLVNLTKGTRPQTHEGG
jgi:hypothetical protein